MDSRGDLALGVDRSVFGNGLLLTVRADFACKAPTRNGRAMPECAKVGPVALPQGADRGSVAFALRCRCLRARSGPADGCRGRGRRCRSRFQRFRCARRSRHQRFRPAAFTGPKKPKDEPGGTGTKDGSLGSGGQSGQQHSTDARRKAEGRAWRHGHQGWDERRLGPRCRGS